jgi:hypothetical protein
MSHIMPTAMQEAAKAMTSEGQNAGTLPGHWVGAGMEVTGMVCMFARINYGILLMRLEFSQAQLSRMAVECGPRIGQGQCLWLDDRLTLLQVFEI